MSIGQYIAFKFFYKWQENGIFSLVNALCKDTYLYLFISINSLTLLGSFLLITLYIQNSLVRPLEVHSRLGGESLHQLLLLLGESNQKTGEWGGKCRLDFIDSGSPHEELIINYAHAGWRTGFQTTEDIDNIIFSPILPLRNQILSVCLECLFVYVCFFLSLDSTYTSTIISSLQ